MKIADEDYSGLKEQIGEYSMKNHIISILILFMLAAGSQSLQAINLSQESSVAILANTSRNLSNQSDINTNATQNQTNETKTITSTDMAATDLWSGEKIPKGYEFNKYGTVTGLTRSEEEAKHLKMN